MAGFGSFCRRGWQWPEIECYAPLDCKVLGKRMNEETQQYVSLRELVNSMGGQLNQ
ncbi:hypothetical protein [Streptococcus pyogenes]|uniref:hypothetical protein n=1 Tax=Streptococcus pyogenes TaxID=1314 RepID=UPI001652BB7D|nr:hypothetical protein [Streptococcus pyogenes]